MTTIDSIEYRDQLKKKKKKKKLNNDKMNNDT